VYRDRVEAKLVARMSPNPGDNPSRAKEERRMALDQRRLDIEQQRTDDQCACRHFRGAYFQ
jgi:hypothetical protein